MRKLECVAVLLLLAVLGTLAAGFSARAAALAGVLVLVLGTPAILLGVEELTKGDDTWR